MDLEASRKNIIAEIPVIKFSMISEIFNGYDVENECIHVLIFFLSAT